MDHAFRSFIVGIGNFDQRADFKESTTGNPRRRLIELLQTGLIALRVLVPVFVCQVNAVARSCPVAEIDTISEVQ